MIALCRKDGDERTTGIDRFLFTVIVHYALLHQVENTIPSRLHPTVKDSRIQPALDWRSASTARAVIVLARNLGLELSDLMFVFLCFVADQLPSPPAQAPHLRVRVRLGANRPTRGLVVRHVRDRFRRRDV